MRLPPVKSEWFQAKLVMCKEEEYLILTAKN